MTSHSLQFVSNHVKYCGF